MPTPLPPKNSMMMHKSSTLAKYSSSGDGRSSGHEKRLWSHVWARLRSGNFFKN